MTLIDIMLTSENAREYGYEWFIDLFEAILLGKIRKIEDLDTKRFWRLGKAKKENGIFGIYRTIRKMNTIFVNKDLLRFSVDEELNLENAKLVGYRWVDDFIYNNSENMEIGLYRTIKSLIEDGYKIGKAKSPINFFSKGWYAPVKENKAM
jgi:hypothetical protein